MYTHEYSCVLFYGTGEGPVIRAASRYTFFHYYFTYTAYYLKPYDDVDDATADYEDEDDDNKNDDDDDNILYDNGPL